jgi:hypothetical protein
MAHGRWTKEHNIYITTLAQQRGNNVTCGEFSAEIRRPGRSRVALEQASQTGKPGVGAYDEYLREGCIPDDPHLARIISEMMPIRLGFYQRCFGIVRSQSFFVLIFFFRYF